MPLNKIKNYTEVYYVVPPPGKIEKVVDNSDNFDEIKFIEILKNSGDIISDNPNGPDNRSAIMVYASDKKENIKPENVVSFIMSQLTCVA